MISWSPSSTSLHKARLLVLAALAATSLPAQGLEPVETRILAGPNAQGHDEAVVADLDRDGNPDYLALTLTHLVLLRGVGTSNPAPLESIPLAGTFFASTLQVVDTNGDGWLDVLVGHGTGLQQRLGDGRGGLLPSTSLSTSQSPVSPGFRVADFDRDGVPDLVRNATGGLGFSRGRGDGSFELPVIVPAPEGGYNSILAGDLDGDADLDVVGVVGGLFGRVRTFLGDGHGGFAQVDSGSPPGALLTGRAVLGDLDGDGFPDLVTAGPVTSVHFSLGDGTFASSVPFATSSSNATLADLDGDGVLDVLRPTTSGIELAPGGRAPEQFLALEQPAQVVAVADVDLDGDLDVLASSTSLLQIRRGVRGSTAGLAGFGSGTPSCGGRIGLGGTKRPVLGAGDFAVVATNVPQGARGVLALGTPVQAGWDPLGIGLVLHFGLALPVAFADADAFGSARFALPIPSRSFLAGLRLTAQSVFVEDASAGLSCSSAEAPLASSRALTITLQR